MIEGGREATPGIRKKVTYRETQAQMFQLIVKLNIKSYYDVTNKQSSLRISKS